MLSSLSIRGIVLIERLDLNFQSGLGVFTGETGAGKSILFDSLGLALGERAVAGMVRIGLDQASVSACFDVSKHHPAIKMLLEQGFDINEGLILRRQLSPDGKSKAFINDQAVSVALLRQVGKTLVEIHGQFDNQKLLDKTKHLELLDEFAGLQPAAIMLTNLWLNWQDKQRAHQDFLQKSQQIREQIEELQERLALLELLAPVPDEEEALLAQRQLLMNNDKILTSLTAALSSLRGENHVEKAIISAIRGLGKVQAQGDTRVKSMIDALERAAIEIEDSANNLESILADIDSDPRPALEKCDERLAELRGAARRLNVGVEALPDLYDSIRQELQGLNQADELKLQYEEQQQVAKVAYQKAAEDLSMQRHQAAQILEQLVHVELAPLKLEKARFKVEFRTLTAEKWNEKGCEHVEFMVTTHAKSAFDSLDKIASGGELARFMLALKVVMTKESFDNTLIFDEVDTGIGGATASALGERLARLAENMQVLVITHSPQVAAKGIEHYQVIKDETSELPLTMVKTLSLSERGEEIARMLSGARITNEARAAAKQLLQN